MSNSSDEQSKLRAFKFYRPEKAGSIFINYYLSNYKNESKKEELETISVGISKLGLDRILRMYDSIEQELNLNVKSENYEMAAKLKQVMDYFKINIIDKAQTQ